MTTSTSSIVIFILHLLFWTDLVSSCMGPVIRIFTRFSEKTAFQERAAGVRIYENGRVQANHAHRSVKLIIPAVKAATALTFGTIPS
jgi:hypothetical protein